MRETPIVRACLAVLAAKRICAWRNNTGGAYYPDGHGGRQFVRFGMPGASDIIGIYSGRFLAIEVKVPGELPTDLQFKFLGMIHDNGGIAVWCDSPEKMAAELRLCGVTEFNRGLYA